MKYRYDDEYVTPLIEGADVEQIKEEQAEEVVTDKERENQEEEYYELPASVKARSRIWSVLSFGLGILSVLLCPFYYISIILAVLSAGLAILSRRILGFFDRFAVLGLIISICGLVAGIFSVIASVSGITDALFAKK